MTNQKWPLQLTRPDQTRPDQTRPDQTRPDHPIVRNSSLELLRIVAMLMIVTFHFFYHGGFDKHTITSTLSGAWIEFWGVGESAGNIGNNLFLLISGYFLVSSRGIKARRVFNLWLRAAFYSIVIFMLFAFTGRAQFNVRGVVIALMPILTRQWWFISYYFLLYMIHPFLNDILHNLSRENYIKFVLVVFVLWSVILVGNKRVVFHYIMDLVCIYVIAGYIRLWADDVKGSRYILYGLAFMATNFVLLRVLRSHSFTVDDKGIYPVAYLCSEVGVLNLAASICLFIGFKGIDMPQSRMTNLMASAVFGVYLIHEHSLIRPFLWREFFRVASYQYSPYLIPYSIAVILIVYISCTLIELARSRIFKALSHGRLS